MFMPSAFESLLVLFCVASHCRGGSIRDNNSNPNNKFKRGVLGGWRKHKKETTTTTTTTTTLKYHEDDKTEIETTVGRSDHRDSSDLLSLRRPSHYNWEAFIHGPTGVASSNERSGPFSLTKASTWSKARGKKKSCKAENAASGSDQRRQMMSEEERLVVETSRRFVDTWSDFLCQGSISFGILSCRKYTRSKKKPKMIARWLRKKKIANPIGDIRFVGNSTASSSSSSLLPRFAPFPVSLLEFGTLVKSKVPYFDNHKGDGRDKNGRVVLCSWDIPLQGGALILEDGPSQQQQKSRQSGTTCGRPRYRGRLVFAIAKIARPPDDPRDGSIQPCGNKYEILTGIREYRPFLAGGGYASNKASKERKPHDTLWDALKTNRETTTRRLCHAFYLSTQSMVHAYCTWRFHQAWRQQLATAIQHRTETIEKDK